MNFIRDIKEKPIETIAAVCLMVVGIGATAITTVVWQQALGGALAAVGGALISFISADSGRHAKAVECLKPELDSTSRHLADTAAKISHIVQYVQSGTITAPLAIDRVAQLTSSLYGTVNDLQILVGTPPDFDMLVETVTNCEEMAASLEKITEQSPGVDRKRLEELKKQLENARLQLMSAGKAFTGVELVKSSQQVECPSCGYSTTTIIGNNPGDSSATSCPKCNTRFHSHRNGAGEIFSRPWGSSINKRMDVTCPECKNKVPLNYGIEKPYEDRFCMNCNCLLRIDSHCEVTVLKHSSEIEKINTEYDDTRKYLTCTKCNNNRPIIWRTTEVVKAVCNECCVVLERKIIVE